MDESRLVPHYMKPSEPSSYHEVCVKNALPPGAEAKPVESSKTDAVGQCEIWKQALNKEVWSVKEWEKNWGFMTQFDAKGNVKEAKELPANLTVFSETVPNTNAENYGSQLDTEIGQRLKDLEFRFYADQRRRKMGSDMVCY